MDAYARDNDDRISRLFPETCDDPTYDAVLAETISDIPHGCPKPVRWRDDLKPMPSVTKPH